MPATVTLEPPGAGLRWHVRLAAKFLIRRYVRKTDASQATAFFRREGDRILALARGLTPEQLAERVLVPPLRGLEDSSRYWSVAMVMEHLEIVNKLVCDLVVALSNGQVPPGQVQIADVKPHATVDATAAIASFEALLARYEATVATRAVPMNATARYAHPWFGPIDAHTWLCFGPLHQRIHRKQIEAIIAGLGQPGPQVIETPRRV